METPAGDEVYTRPEPNRIGRFAELISIAEGSVARKPRDTTIEEGNVVVKVR